MEEKRGLKEYLKNNLASVILFFIIISAIGVFAGDVVFQNGNMNLADNLGVSGNITAGKFIGDGSLLTGIPGEFEDNISVEDYYVCPSRAAEIDDTELVTNGGFTGDSSGWNEGVDWSYDDNNEWYYRYATFSGGYGYSNLNQTTPISIESGKTYRVKYTISSWYNDGGGDVPANNFLLVALGGQTVHEHYSYGSGTEDGEKTYYVTATNTDSLNFKGQTGQPSPGYSSTLQFYLDNVSVKEVTIPAGKVCWFDGSTKANAYYVTSDRDLKSEINLADNSSDRNLYEYIFEGQPENNLKTYGLMTDELPDRLKVSVEGEWYVALYSLVSQNYVDIGKLLDWNKNSEERIVALENELCAKDDSYSWC